MRHFGVFVACVVLACASFAAAPAFGAEELDGAALEKTLKQEGTGGRTAVEVPKEELAHSFRSTENVEVTYILRHQWRKPITLKGDADGKVFSMGVMVAAVDDSGRLAKCLLPCGPGTIYIIHGKVHILGVTLCAQGSDPLKLLVHNATGRAEADANFATEGPLATVTISVPKTPPRDVGKSTPFLQLVHIEGKGYAITRDGKRIGLGKADSVEGEPTAGDYPVRVTVAIDKKQEGRANLSWELLKETPVRNAMVFVVDPKSGQGKAIILPEKPPVSLGPLTPGDYEAWISDVSNPFKGSRQISNRAKFTVP